MICINDTSMIYVACPANHATGGTELLHQLVHKLSKKGFPVKIFYYNAGINSKEGLVHPAFEKYGCESVTSIIDEAKFVLIVPEIKAELLLKYKNLKKVIWWLSVDNFYWKPRRIRIARFFGFYKSIDINNRQKLDIHAHLVQSHYAKDHLEMKGITNIYYLSDYLNEAFFVPSEKVQKENVVLYNPRKGWKFTKKLIKASQELQWRALENMSPADIVNLMRRSKVYIDFGNHPGMDRFPREAAISGCCIITGRKGSAAFDEDVAIPAEFKFKDVKVEINNIIAKINSCMMNYETEYIKFNEYRDFIEKQESDFEKDIDKIFKYC